MLTIVETPTNAQVPRNVATRFTPERSKALRESRLAGIARRKERLAQAKLDHQRLVAEAIAKLQAGIQPITNPAPVKTCQELELVEEQIAHAREVLNGGNGYCPACERSWLEPHHRAQLLKALDTLLDRKRELNGIPRAGSRRPAPEKPRSRSQGLLED